VLTVWLAVRTMSAMRMRIPSVACVLLLVGGLSASPTCVLKGHVRDARTGEPLVGASVVVRGTECGNATDLKGNYVIVGLPAMTGTVTAAYVGYDDASASFTTTAACTTHLDFGLRVTVVEVNHIECRVRQKSSPRKSSPLPVKPRRTALPLPALRNANKHSDRFPIQVYGNDGLNSKWGYMDKTGKVVIKPQFETAEHFSCGLALVKVDGSFRYIDAAGDYAFGGKFEQAAGYSEGMASVLIQGYSGGKAPVLAHDSVGGRGGWGVIDKRGKILRSRFGNRVVFSEGLAWFDVKDWGYGAIDPSGDTVIRPMFGFIVRPFSDGLAQASFGHHVGFLDKAGHVAIKPQFDQAADFHEGMAYFMNKRDNAPDRRGYINKTGKVVIKPQFEDARDFSEGLAPVMIGGKWGYINRAGKVVIAPQFAEARGFSEGLAVVSGIDNSPLYGYIDKRGEVVINPQFSRADDFSDGLAQVRVGDKPRPRYRLDEGERWLPIERSGKPQPDYGEVYRTGYIDRTGKYVW
jgi:hypothetical protein